jgi:hypothetical protein
VDPRAGLDDVENRKFLTLPEVELRPFGRPARRQSLHRPSTPTLSMKYGAVTLPLIQRSDRTDLLTSRKIKGPTRLVHSTRIQVTEI